MIPTELIQKIRRLELRTSRKVNEVLLGEYHSAFKGRGIEFEEVRPYQAGDDVRAIDWNVTARTGEPYIKLFREEREMRVMLLVDMSASLDFGSRGQLKREVVTEAAAAIAFSAIGNQDRVGMVGFTDQIEKVVPAAKGKKHVLRVIRELLATEAVGHGTNINVALDHLNRTVKRHAVVFVISDFFDNGYIDLMKIAHRKHDLVPVVIEDQREQQLPSIGLINLQDAESGRMITIDSSSKRGQKLYKQMAEQKRQTRDQAFAKAKLDVMRLNTGSDLIEQMQQFFVHRTARLYR